MWSVKHQKEILPNIEMVSRIIFNLNDRFDSCEIFHHQHEEEIFEFEYKIIDKKSECWNIKFLDKIVCNGVGEDFPSYYGDSHDLDDDYLFLIEDNEDEIYNICCKNTIQIIEQFLCIIKNSFAYDDGDIKNYEIEKKIVDKV